MSLPTFLNIFGTHDCTFLGDMQLLRKTRNFDIFVTTGPYWSENFKTLFCPTFRFITAKLCEKYAGNAGIYISLCIYKCQASRFDVKATFSASCTLYGVQSAYATKTGRTSQSVGHLIINGWSESKVSTSLVIIRWRKTAEQQEPAK